MLIFGKSFDSSCVEDGRKISPLIMNSPDCCQNNTSKPWSIAMSTGLMGKPGILTRFASCFGPLARNESTTATNRALKNDIKEIDDEDIDVETVAEYLNLFERLFLLDNQRPFSTNIRSSVRVKQSVKRQFFRSIPGLCVAGDDGRGSTFGFGNLGIPV